MDTLCVGCGTCLCCEDGRVDRCDGLLRLEGGRRIGALLEKTSADSMLAVEVVND
jgi:hypothetical protein